MAHPGLGLIDRPELQISRTASLMGPAIGEAKEAQAGILQFPDRRDPVCQCAWVHWWLGDVLGLCKAGTLEPMSCTRAARPDEAR